MAGIRRAEGTPWELGIFEASGSLRGATGRAGVRQLRVGRGALTLEALAGFPDLRMLEVSKTQALDLSPLAFTAIECLRLEQVDGFDLSPIERIRPLRDLQLVRTRSSRFPPVLTLPRSLAAFMALGEGSDEVSRLFAAIDWTALPRLRRLALMGDTEDPARADLSFIRALPDLLELRVWRVLHVGPGSSPLDPPYAGLPRGLRRLEIDAVDQAAAEDVLSALLPDTRLVVRRRFVPSAGYDPSDRWQVGPFEDEGTTEWSVYGTLCDLPAFQEYEIEYDAAEAAEVMIREADPDLADRLDFDPEAGGTGIAAPTRDDLETALRIVGAVPS